MRALDRLDELLWAQPKLDVDLVAGSSKLIKARLGDLLGDEDTCHGSPSGVGGIW